jgi:uncharacterized phage protein gp47/JayE
MANTDLWGVTGTGFYRPTLEDIIAEKNKVAKEIFGEDFETGELTPQGKFFRVNAAAESKLCEIAEGIYYSIFPSTATGISLDRVSEFANLTRENAGYAVHTIKVYGEQDYVLEAGTLFRNTAGIEFYSVKEDVIENEETVNGEAVYYALVTVQCTESGTVGNVTNINATVELDTSIQAVSWVETISYGTEIETDPELREKFGKAIQGMGANTATSIKANVLRVAGVNDVIIIDNNTEEDIVLSDSLTVPSGSYAVIVHSDSLTNEVEIAEAIFAKQPFAIKQIGKISVDVRDDAEVDHTVKFSYVENVPVEVTVACTVDSTFPSDGLTQIQDSIRSYINGLGIGEEVVYSRLYDYIYNVTGVYKVTDITMDGKKTDIELPKINIAKAGAITVSITSITGG